MMLYGKCTQNEWVISTLKSSDGVIYFDSPANWIASRIKNSETGVIGRRMGLRVIAPIL
jgi:hypothetical protein